MTSTILKEAHKLLSAWGEGTDEWKLREIANLLGVDYHRLNKRLKKTQ